MKIALCSSFVPFINGGYRNIIEWLQLMLEKEGHTVEVVYLPEVDEPDLLFSQMAAFRWVDLSAADRVICFRPQSHLIRHPHKILWFIHHIRVFYDMWGGPYSIRDNAKNRGIRDALHDTDTAALREAKRIFTNSKVVSRRLKDFNKIDSEVLYPPVLQSERFHSRQYGDEIVCICRFEHHKRQHLLIEAMRYTKTPVRLRLCGTGSGQDYTKKLQSSIKQHNLTSKVQFEDRWITEEEKVEMLSDCLAAAYLPIDEDSYGYPSVEASHASKAIITTSDSGGVLELVQDGVNGFVVDATPKALAEVMDKLYADRQLAEKLGRNACTRLDKLNISWSHVIKRLLA